MRGLIAIGVLGLLVGCGGNSSNVVTEVCRVEQIPEGALISCPDGSQELVPNPEIPEIETPEPEIITVVYIVLGRHICKFVKDDQDRYQEIEGEDNEKNRVCSKFIDSNGLRRRFQSHR